MNNVAFYVNPDHHDYFAMTEQPLKKAGMPVTSRVVWFLRCAGRPRRWRFSKPGKVESVGVLWERKSHSLTEWLLSLGLGRLNIDCSELAAVFRVGFDIKGYPLIFTKAFVAGAYNGGEMYKDIFASVIVGNETKSFFRIEPFNCTTIHPWHLL
jgi:hypothetical protein